jgi:hypothetical protein
MSQAGFKRLRPRDAGLQPCHAAAVDRVCGCHAGRVDGRKSRIWRKTSGSGEALDARIASLAAPYGNVTRGQLLALGMGKDAIAYRVRIGRLHREFAGVYSVGRPARTALERAHAAVLACGPGAALDRFSALALWGFISSWPPAPQVAVPRDRRPAGVRTRVVAAFGPGELTTQLGIRTASPARAMLDCAPELARAGRLTRVLHDALNTPYLFESQMEELCRRHPADRGARPLLAELAGADGPSRSGWELRFPADCVRHGLPRPVMNHRIGPYTVDAWFELERVAAELDGWRWHRDRASFERNRERDAALLDGHGIVTVRIADRAYQRDPRRELERLGRILATRRAQLAA